MCRRSLIIFKTSSAAHCQIHKACLGSDLQIHWALGMGGGGLVVCSVGWMSFSTQDMYSINQQRNHLPRNVLTASSYLLFTSVSFHPGHGGSETVIHHASWRVCVWMCLCSFGRPLRRPQSLNSHRSLIIKHPCCIFTDQRRNFLPVPGRCDG